MNSPITQQRLSAVAFFLIVVISADCQRRSELQVAQTPQPPAATQKPWAPNTSPQLKQLVESAIDQTKVTTGYDPSYVGIDYPGGDVPLETGVCSDVVVRAFRKAGIDLQKEIHDDMGRAWSVYPRKWGASRPDSNIDHRRVLNLMTYFDRQGKNLAISDQSR